MNYLLTGTWFNNKGSEAMALTALNNICRVDREAGIYIIKNDFITLPFELNDKVHFFEISDYQIELLLHGYSKKTIKQIIKDFIKFFIPKKKSYFFKLKKAKKVLQSIDYLVDISGFSVSSKWEDLRTIRFANRLLLLKKYGAKLYLMPQSFGPFNYDDPKVLEYGLEAVKLCEIVYAREKAGYLLLKSHNLQNVVYSPDSVLIEKEYDLNNVIKNSKEVIEDIEVSGLHNVAVVPNYRLVDRAGYDLEGLMGFYKKIIDSSDETYHFYLIAHAEGDMVLCKKLYESYRDDPKVTLIDHVLLSFNYQKLCSKLDFTIASRYHAIVHAYKEGIPSIIIGWADKYCAIAELFNQEKYLIDFSSMEEAYGAVELIKQNYAAEGKHIQNKLRGLQEKSCYGWLKK